MALPSTVVTQLLLAQPQTAEKLVAARMRVLVALLAVAVVTRTRLLVTADLMVRPPKKPTKEEKAQPVREPLPVNLPM